MTTALDINQFVYHTGTLTIAPGDTVATFTGTLLQSGPVRDGDWLFAGGTIAVIKSVASETEAELFIPFGGEAVTDGPYFILKASLLRYQPALIAVETGQLLAKISQEQVIYNVTGDEPDPSIGKEGDGAWKSNVTPWKFWKFLSGEWVLQGSPAEKGDKGDDATIQVGDTVTLAPDSLATVENVGTPGAAVLNFGIPAGPASLKPIEPWATGVDYVVGPPASFVSQAGSAYECLIPHTSGTFAADLAAGKWGLVAAKGIDGTGTGDVQGPASSTDGGLVVFDGADGKHVKALDDADAALSELGGGAAGIEVFKATAAAVIRNLIMSSAEKSYWSDMAALLDPAAYTFTFGLSKSVTVPSGKNWYLVNSWFMLLGTTGQWLFQRINNARDGFVVPMPAGTNLTSTSVQNGYCYICDPSAVNSDSRYSDDPRGLFYDRLNRLKGLTLNETFVNIALSSAQGTSATANFDNDFTNGIVTLVSNHETAWTGLVYSGGGAMNLENEISDDHQWRYGRAVTIPFQRSAFTGIQARAASITGESSGFSSLQGRAAVLYVKLPSDW
ncbi:hypothetical protein V1291_000061 [Nitrobacteraceae bacterium AZCC 1564]